MSCYSGIDLIYSVLKSLFFLHKASFHSWQPRMMLKISSGFVVVSIMGLYLSLLLAIAHQSMTSSAHNTSPVGGSPPQSNSGWKCDEIYTFRCRKRQLKAWWGCQMHIIANKLSIQSVCYYIYILTYLCNVDFNSHTCMQSKKKSPKKSLSYGRRTSTRPGHHRPFIGFQAGSGAPEPGHGAATPR